MNLVPFLRSGVILSIFTLAGCNLQSVKEVYLFSTVVVTYTALQVGDFSSQWVLWALYFGDKGSLSISYTYIF